MMSGLLWDIMQQSVFKSKELSVETKAAIVRAVCEILDDPDLGLELSARARIRLRKAMSPRGKSVPLSAIREKYA